MKSFYWFKISLLTLLFLVFGLLVSEKINLPAVDLGRHIKNGEEVISCLKTAGFSFNNCPVLSKNYYSYTYPDYTFLNHHWGSGVVFYLINKFFGFAGLSVFFVFISLATFWLFFDIARQKSSFGAAFLVSLIFLPVITFRREIRPEVFSYFFSGLFWWLVSQSETGRINKNWLWSLPFLMIFWANLHIYFFLGFLILGVSLLKNLVKGRREETRNIFLILVFSTLGALINPAGMKAVLYPLNIFKEYGYRVLENQTVWFIDRVVGKYPPNLFFKIGFLSLLASWVFPIQQKKLPFDNVIFGVFFSFLGLTAIRNFTIFGLFCLPIVSGNLSFALSQKSLLSDQKRIFFGFFTAVFIFFGLFIVNTGYWLNRNTGWGLEKGVDSAAEFFNKNKLAGPVFNNYDIGSYLIYYLSPAEKVFVDNRPEAYPVDFFTNTYIPMQEENAKWEQASGQYTFNVIFFYRRDLTPWAQSFLISRINDAVWAPVFVDAYNIIFLKRNNENKEIITKFELPKALFQVQL